MSENGDFERRAMYRRECDDMRKDVNQLFTEYTKASNFIAQARITGIVAMTIFVGSFLYTADHKADAEKRFTELKVSTDTKCTEQQRAFQASVDRIVGRLNSQEDRIDNLNIDFRINAERMDRIFADLGILKSQVEQLLKILEARNKSMGMDFITRPGNENQVQATRKP